MNEEEFQGNPIFPMGSEVVNEFDISKMPEAISGHMWRQEGTQLICQSCPFKHATFIEPGLQLYGIDKDGSPLIRKITIDS